MLTDILSIPEARVAVGAADERHDDELAVMNAAVSIRLDALCGPIVNRTVTEYHDGGYGAVLLNQAPVASITSVTEYDAGTPTVLTAETATSAGTYLLDGEQIIRRETFHDTCFTPGRRNVKVVYVAGRAADTAAVSTLFKQAAAVTLQHLWSGFKGFGNQTFGAAGDFVGGMKPWDVPKAALMLLSAELRVPGMA